MYVTVLKVLTFLSFTVKERTYLHNFLVFYSVIENITFNSSLNILMQVIMHINHIVNCIGGQTSGKYADVLVINISIFMSAFYTILRNNHPILSRHKRMIHRILQHQSDSNAYFMTGVVLAICC